MRIVQARECVNTMIDTLSKGLKQKPAMVKGVSEATPSRAFALWLALLFLYFLLLPTTAETPGQAAEMAAGGEQTVNLAPRYR